MRFCDRCWQLFDDDALTACPRDGAPLRAAPGAADPLEGLVGGRVDGRFLVTAPLGRGSMGAVFRAVELATGREVALKVMRADLSDALARRFTREIEVTARLAHPHTVATIAFGHDRGRGLLYLALELLEGETLKARLAQRRRLPWEEALRVAVEAAASLGEAHAKGIVHRDVKPANLFLARAPDARDVVKVLDFGVAKLRTEEALTVLTLPGTVLGSARYMAPEQVTGGALDGRTDLYALGVVLFEALTGRVPFDAPTAAEVFELQCVAEVPESEALDAAPGGVADLVHLLLEKDPRDRLRDAAELEARGRALLP
ncbi:MAG: serine/threonine protein kinase [Deltaproteobacteria bacterium]|nr:MAG: serine/threonine protein kinase [Deltaproteobacteria bacterium]